MKKLLILLSFTGILSANVNWHSYTELEQGLEQQTIEKPIVIVVGASTCHYCKAEVQLMNSSEEYYSLVNTDFYSVYVNQDQIELPPHLNAETTPTTFILDPKNGFPLVQSPAVGAVPIDQMIEYLTKINIAYKEYINKQ